MTKRFKKVLSTLCIIALLATVIPAAIADDDNTEAPAVETAPIVEEIPAAQEAPAVEEVPVAQEAPAVQEVPAQEEIPETAPAVEEAPAQEAPVAVEEIPEVTEAPVVTEAPIAEEVPAVTEAPAAEEAPAEETAPAATDVPADEQEDAEPETEPVSEDIINEGTSEEIVDELRIDEFEFSDDEIKNMDGPGSIDDEVAKQFIPEVTPEMKYPEITELKIGSQVSGYATADADGMFFIETGRTQAIVLKLYVQGSAVQVRINNQIANFAPAADGSLVYEMVAVAGTGYTFSISSVSAAFVMTAEAKKIEEEVAEDAAEETEATEETEETVETETADEQADDQSAAPAADEDAAQADAEETTEEVVAVEDNNEETADNVISAEDTAEENNEETTEENNEETAEENNEETAEENIEENNETETNDIINEETVAEAIINAWVSTEEANYAIGGQVNLIANADVELDNAIVWQTRTANGEWEKAGYGLKLTVDLTEENAGNSFRFKLADGTLSSEYKLNTQTAVAEAEEVTEETSEEEIAEVTDIEEATEEEAAEEEIIEETAEAEAIETEATAEETVTEDAEEEIEGETAEDIEDTTEEEIEEEVSEPLTDEQMLEMGYIKVFVGMDIGANVYSSADETANAVDHLDAGTEMWIKLIEGSDKAAIYNGEDEEPIAYINLVDLIATMKPENVIDLPTRYLTLHSSLEDMEYVEAGYEVTMFGILENFSEDDVYEIKWQFSEDGVEFIDIEDANELTYTYQIDLLNAYYTWNLSVVLLSQNE